MGNMLDGMKHIVLNMKDGTRESYEVKTGNYIAKLLANFDDGQFVKIGYITCRGEYCVDMFNKDEIKNIRIETMD